MYYKEHVKPLLKWLTTDAGVSPLSGDSEDSYESDADMTSSRIVEAYPAEKTPQPIPGSETKLACSCTGKQYNLTVHEFQQVLYEIFEYDNYTGLTKNQRSEGMVQRPTPYRSRKSKVVTWFFPSFVSDILKKMKEIGWQLDIDKDGAWIFSRSKVCSKVKGNSVSKEFIMGDEEDVTLSQLASCPIVKSNDLSI